MIFCAQGKEGNSLIKVLFIFADFFFTILLTGLLNSLEGKAYKRLGPASSRLRQLHQAVQGRTARQGSISPDFMLFAMTVLLSTAGLISMQVYLNSTSQEKNGTVYTTFDLFGL